MKIGILVSRIRVEEKLLFEEMAKRGLDFDRLYDGELIFDLDKKPFGYDVILERSLHHGRALYIPKSSTIGEFVPSTLTKSPAPAATSF